MRSDKEEFIIDKILIIGKKYICTVGERRRKKKGGGNEEVTKKEDGRRKPCGNRIMGRGTRRREVHRERKAEEEREKDEDMKGSKEDEN